MTEKTRRRRRGTDVDRLGDACTHAAGVGSTASLGRIEYSVDYIALPWCTISTSPWTRISVAPSCRLPSLRCLVHASSDPARHVAARSTPGSPMTCCVVVPQCSHGRSGPARSSLAVAIVSCHVHDLVSHRCAQAASTSSSASAPSAASASALWGSCGHGDRSPGPAFLPWVKASQRPGPPRRRASTVRTEINHSTNRKASQMYRSPADDSNTDI